MALLGTRGFLLILSVNCVSILCLFGRSHTVPVPMTPDSLRPLRLCGKILSFALKSQRKTYAKIRGRFSEWRRAYARGN